MPLPEKYIIVGIIDDAKDMQTGLKRKRVAVVKPYFQVAREYDINANIPNKKGPIMAHTKNVLGVPSDMIKFSDMLNRVLPD